MDIWSTKPVDSSMEMMSRKSLCLSLLATLGLFLLALSFAHSAEIAEDKEIGEVKTRSLPNLFDFEHYKNVFKKKYTSLREELVRRKIVLAKALRAFISGIAYKFKRSKFYLALNPRSDRTPEELRRTIPKVRPLKSLGDSEVQARIYKVKSDDSTKPELVDEEDIAKELGKITQKVNEGEEEVLAAVSEQLENHNEAPKRSKRSTDSSSIRKAFTFDNLLKEPKTKRSKKHYDSIESNNPEYEPPEVNSMAAETPTEAPMSEEVINQLLSSEQTQGKNEGEQSKGLIANYISALSNWLVSSETKLEAGQKSDNNDDDDSDNEVYVDHGKSECMIEVGSQDQCGSCYAWSLTSLYSWILCQQTGKLVPMSVQYVVDCGPESKHSEAILGCDGGYVTDVGHFFEDYGLELARNYPYVDKEGKCPYENLDNSSSMGYIRLNKGSGKEWYIEYNDFENQLEQTPLVITIGASGSFNDYGGGIHDGENCCPEEGDLCGEHAVVLVGHGVEEGEEYWIIRNSYSENFGEKGYYRLSKKADCIWPKYGLIYGLEKDGYAHITPHKNRLRPKEVQTKITNKSRYRKPTHKKREE